MGGFHSLTLAPLGFGWKGHHVRNCRRSRVWAGRRLDRPIVDALKRLECRGYDSAGLATLENEKLERGRAEGKLSNLEAKLAAAPLSGSIGIGQSEAGLISIYRASRRADERLGKLRSSSSVSRS
jgi:hypothetical protein